MRQKLMRNTNSQWKFIKKWHSAASQALQCRKNSEEAAWEQIESHFLSQLRNLLEWI